MDQMLPSPSFNIPSIGTPHHAMEEDQMIAPSAQEAQQTARNQQNSNLYSYGGFTPQAASQTPSGLLSQAGQTPHNLLGRDRARLCSRISIVMLRQLSYAIKNQHKAL